MIPQHPLLWSIALGLVFLTLGLWPGIAVTLLVVAVAPKERHNND